MRHLTISNFGTFVGVSGNRLVVKDKERSFETVLSRLRSIRIDRGGISLSSDVIAACAARGIRLYFTDWRGTAVAAVQGVNQQATVALRQSQFECIKTGANRLLACEIIRSKIKNQRAVLLYFGKYLKKAMPDKEPLLYQTAILLEQSADKLKNWHNADEHWRDTLLGIEGKSAVSYWNALTGCELLPRTFTSREGRGSTEITNAALNYGYAILNSYCWASLDNTGLELYAGLLHANHPGRASLVTDFIEEYRAWVVDRNIIKLRKQLSTVSELTPEIKRAIVTSVDETMASRIKWHGKELRLESLMQRQAYRLAGAIAGKAKYRGVHFKW